MAQEEARHIQLERPGRAPAVCGNPAEELHQPVAGRQRPLALPAGVGVVDEDGFTHLLLPGHREVVDLARRQSLTPPASAPPMSSSAGGTAPLPRPDRGPEQARDPPSQRDRTYARSRRARSSSLRGMIRRMTTTVPEIR